MVSVPTLDNGFGTDVIIRYQYPYLILVSNRYLIIVSVPILDNGISSIAKLKGILSSESTAFVRCRDERVSRYFVTVALASLRLQISPRDANLAQTFERLPEQKSNPTCSTARHRTGEVVSSRRPAVPSRQPLGRRLQQLPLRRRTRALLQGGPSRPDAPPTTTGKKTLGEPPLTGVCSPR